MKKFITLMELFILSFSKLNSGTTQQIWVPATNKNNYDLEKILSQSPKIFIDPAEKKCLALNIYFEAAIESTAGKLAVAQVTLNRVRSNRYPDTICEVVKEGAHYSNGFPKRNACQFSWYCDGKGDIPRQTRSWTDSQQIADYIMNKPDLIDITDGATHYHADYINPPRWALKRQMTLQIDTHIFYNKTRF